MKKDLKEFTQEWMQLERKTLEQRRQADEFYESNLMALIEEDFIKRNQEKVCEKAEYIVISSYSRPKGFYFYIRIKQKKHSIKLLDIAHWNRIFTKNVG